MLNTLRHAIFKTLSARLFYGWVIVPVAAISMFATGPGQSHLIGLFFDPISTELGLSRTSIAIAYGSATLVAALLLPKMGGLIDRFGAATILWLIALGLGLSCILFSFAANWIYVAVGFAFLRFLGQGSLILNCTNIVSQWFSRRRGFALGLMSLGFPISMALHPPLCQWLIETIGWRQTWVWLGVSTWVLMLPPILLLAHSKPEQVGLTPDGITTPQESERASAVTGLTLKEALTTPAFYILTTSLFFLSMLVTALHVENKSILMHHGLSATQAASMFTVIGITAALSSPLVGRMLDRFRSERMLSGGLLIMSASLVSITLVHDLKSAVVYALIFGLNNGITMTYFAFLLPRYFGRKHLGNIQGVSQMVGVLGASLGPLPLALALDFSGNYDFTLKGLAIIPIICSVVALFLREPPQLSQSAHAATPVPPG